MRTFLTPPLQLVPLLERAVKNGDTLYVSQAMYDLMQGATHEELMHLFENLEFFDMSQFNVMQPMPPMMTFQDPELPKPFEWRCRY